MGERTGNRRQRLKGWPEVVDRVDEPTRSQLSILEATRSRNMTSAIEHNPSRPELGASSYCHQARLLVSVHHAIGQRLYFEVNGARSRTTSAALPARREAGRKAL